MHWCWGYQEYGLASSQKPSLLHLTGMKHSPELQNSAAGHFPIIPYRTSQGWALTQKKLYTDPAVLLTQGLHPATATALPGRILPLLRAPIHPHPGASAGVVFQAAAANRGSTIKLLTYHFSFDKIYKRRQYGALNLNIFMERWQSLVECTGLENRHRVKPI